MEAVRSPALFTGTGLGYNCMNPYCKWHPFWDLDSFDLRHHHNRMGRDDSPPAGNSGRRYPVRLLRYWFMDHLIRREAGSLGRPIDVCEVGVGDGQMLDFITSPPDGSHRALPAWIKTWDGVSKTIDRPRLSALGYSRCYETNIEKPIPDLAAQYDVLILLHILEHLHSPESVLDRLVQYVRPGGLILGGCPTIPDLLRPIRERQLRRGAEPFGHVSVISSERVRRMARQYQMKVELLTGAYLIRSTGSRVEDSRAWLRFNLIAGALTTGWMGELYWSLRKPHPANAA